MTYRDIRPIIKTGDLIAFSGKSPFSKLIRWVTRSDTSHVGIVYRTTEDRVIIMESTSECKQKDAQTGEVRKGVASRYLSQRITGYHGSVFLQRLRWSHVPNEAKMIKWLTDAHGKRVPYDMMQAMGAGIDIWDYIGVRNDREFSEVFCSEMVAKALQVGGAVDSHLNPSEATPADVCLFDCYRTSPKICLG